MRLLKLWFVISLLCLASCASKTDISSIDLKSQEAVAFILREEPQLDNVRLTLRAFDPTAGKLSREKTGLLFYEPEDRLVASVIEPGTYAVQNVVVTPPFGSSPPINQLCYTRTVTFEVRPGEVLLIGEHDELADLELWQRAFITRKPVTGANSTGGARYGAFVYVFLPETASPSIAPATPEDLSLAKDILASVQPSLATRLEPAKLRAADISSYTKSLFGEDNCA